MGPTPKPAKPSPTPETPVSEEKVVIDPQKGGQVAANDKSKNTITLDAKEGHWVWQRLVEVLEVDLVKYVGCFCTQQCNILTHALSPNWEIRHGAAMALRDVVKAQGSCGGMIGRIINLSLTLVVAHLLFIDGLTSEQNASNHECWCNQLAAKFLLVFVLDRFGDFVGDQVCISLPLMSQL